MSNIFDNYNSQKIKNKELIIVLNNNKLNIDDWKKHANKHENVSVYQLDERKSLGYCLNSGAQKAKFDFIAKFDDDDYYGSKYIESSIKVFDNKDVSIVGKSANFVYLEGSNRLLLLREKLENRFVKHIAGASLIFKKEIINKVPFNDLNVGEDIDFLKRCNKYGYQIYSTTKHHFAIVRRQNVNSHTWKISEERLLKITKTIPFSGDYRKIVNNLT